MPHHLIIQEDTELVGNSLYVQTNGLIFQYAIRSFRKELHLVLGHVVQIKAYGHV
jgi:hypothetical protein